MASRSRRPSGGGGKNGTVAKVIWFLVIAGLVVAFFNIPYDPGVSGVKNILISKSQTVQSWASNAAPNFEKFVNGIIKGGSKAPSPVAPGSTGSTGGATGKPSSSAPTTGSKNDIMSVLNSLKIANISITSYNVDKGSFKEKTTNHADYYIYTKNWGNVSKIRDSSIVQIKV